MTMKPRARALTRSSAQGAKPCCATNGCAAQRAGLPLREAFDLTCEEETALDVVRLVLSAHASASARFWDSALEHAEMQAGPRLGPALVTQAAALVRALRVERTVPFSFLSFACDHISGDEIDLVSALQTVSLGPDGERAESLGHLVRAATFRRVDQALTDLACVLSAMAEGLPFEPSTLEPVPSPRHSLH